MTEVDNKDILEDADSVVIAHNNNSRGCKIKSVNELTQKRKQELLGDILANLRYWANEHKVDWQQADEYGERHFNWEKPSE